MNLQERITLLSALGHYLLSGDSTWQTVKEKAGQENGWFIPAFVDLAVENIAHQYLDEKILLSWTHKYQIPQENPAPKTVGIVMAGNIPLVGFHDMLCVFITGNKSLIKLSSKDSILIKHLVEKMATWNKEVEELIRFADMLKGCDAYIATGSKNSAGYFAYYFGKYPNIIRQNRTSVAVLKGNETKEELEKLADDVHQYFGLGCRNVTKIFVPAQYDFIPLLEAFKKYSSLADHHKFKNNYDYNLALHILNKKEYMSNETVLLVQEDNIFAPVSQVNYAYYHDGEELRKQLAGNNDIQCVTGSGYIPFGHTQLPAIDDYADGIDTIAFLQSLRN